MLDTLHILVVGGLFMIGSTGLTEKEVEESRKKYGSNTISQKKTKTFFHQFIETLGDPIIKILLIALVIKTIFLFKDFDWFETLGIVIAIFLSSLISTVSEYGSEKAFQSLQEEASRIKSKVKREGNLKEISIDDLVVGDIVRLETGDRIPADGILIEGELTVDESSLNGETREAYKEAVHGSVTDKNRVYRGTVVYSKVAFMRVEKVGNDTYYGKLALELQEENPESPLKGRLRELAKFISKIGYVGAFLVAISYLFSVVVIDNNFQIDKIISTVSNFRVFSGYVLYSLTLAVTIIVVAVPEGLPMMITLVLSSNMKRMLKNNVLVRKLVGIETAGNINILYTDKTGTLTKGKLEVVGVLTGVGNRYDTELELSSYKRYHDLLKVSLVYNNESSKNQEGKVIGVVGPIGCGKTTLLELIKGMKLPTSGTIQFEEYTIGKQGILGDEKTFQSAVGFLPQFPDNKFLYDTVEKELDYVLEKCNYSPMNRNKHILQALTMVGLNESYLSRYPFSLSSGEARKLSLATILACNPKVLLLDEPIIGMDSNDKKSLVTILTTIKSRYKKIIIIASSDVDFLSKVADELVIMKDGKVLMYDDKKAVLKNEKVFKEAKIELPMVTKFENYVLKKKKIQLGHRTEVNDLVKDILRTLQ